MLIQKLIREAKVSIPAEELKLFNKIFILGSIIAIILGIIAVSLKLTACPDKVEVMALAFIIIYPFGLLCSYKIFLKALIEKGSIQNL